MATIVLGSGEGVPVGGAVGDVVGWGEDVCVGDGGPEGIGDGSVVGANPAGVGEFEPGVAVSLRLNILHAETKADEPNRLNNFKKCRRLIFICCSLRCYHSCPGLIVSHQNP
jgi:hypothetical protein